MERPEFEISISKTGKLKVHIKGVKGQRCVQLADLLKEIVGREDQRSLTSDFHEPDIQVRINAKVKDSS